MKKIILTFGLIAGGIISAPLVVLVPFKDAFGGDKGAVIGYTSMVLAFLLIFFGVRQYRDTAGRGRVTFGRALAIGTLITLVSSACYTATWVIYFGFHPDFTAQYTAHQIDKLKASGASQAAIDKKVAELKEFAKLYDNPLYNAAVTMLEPLPVGIVLALVAAGVLSRRRRDTDYLGTSTGGGVSFAGTQVTK
jgi:hypothetical protein